MENTRRSCSRKRWFRRDDGESPRMYVRRSMAYTSGSLVAAVRQPSPRYACCSERRTSSRRPPASEGGLGFGGRGGGGPLMGPKGANAAEIGRASCRERV